MNSKCILLGLALAVASVARADFAPIPLTAGSYNADIIVEQSAPHLSNYVTTASVDNGTGNSGFSWFERGYYTPENTLGIPTSGSTFVCASNANHSFTMPPSYTVNDAVLIDSAVPTATITMTAPAAYSTLSLLASSGGGTVTIRYVVHHADSTTETNSFTTSDWFSGAGSKLAVGTGGRVDVIARSFGNIGSAGDAPRIFFQDLPLVNTSSSVTSIDLSRVSGGGHACILAISGSTGGAFSPIVITGYNQDMIVEASAQQGMALNSLYTSASVDNGRANSGGSWYEQGFHFAAPSTGVPLAGSTITNQSASDHRYIMAPSYASNNVLYIDSFPTSATATLASPATYSGLSFFCSAGHGPLTIDYTVHHADSSAEVGTFVVRDWFGGAPIAWNANGRVNVVSGVLDSVNSGNPNLYSTDITLTNTTSAVNSIDLSYSASNTGFPGQAGILAISGTAGAVSPIIGSQPVSVNTLLPGASVQFSVSASGTQPLSYRWQKVPLGGGVINLSDGGNISGSTTSSLTLSTVSLSDEAGYQVVVSNAVGLLTSVAARLNIVSTNQNILSASDTNSVYNGNAGDGAEGVASAIDGTTQKYLNLASGTPPFVGPVGLMVSPTVGGTIVKGLRIYTANDLPERDPANYTLEGSYDGTNFVTFSSGPLALPFDRNLAGFIINPTNYFNQEVDFSNNTAYNTYRLSFSDVRSDGTSSIMQLAEVELLGRTGAVSSDVSITIQSLSGGQLQVQWPQGLLLQATDLTGPWVTNSADVVSPYTVAVIGSQMFFRVLKQ